MAREARHFDDEVFFVTFCAPLFFFLQHRQFIDDRGKKKVVWNEIGKYISIWQKRSHFIMQKPLTSEE